MPQIMEENAQEEEKTYHKSIDALIEDAEIEAEIEAEKTVRSKNARLLSISLVGIALIAFIYWQVTGATSPEKEGEVALPELTEAPPVGELSEETGPATVAEESAQAPVADADALSEPAPAPAVSEETQPEIPEPANVQPEVAKAAPVPPAEKQEESVIVQAPPEKPATPAVAKPVVTAQAPVATQSISTPAVKKYFVQLGLFSIQDNAKGFAERIRKKGFIPSIRGKNVEAERYVVFVGGFSNKESGSESLSDLKAKGFNSVMEKLPDNSYTIVLGKFVTSSQAEALRDKLSFEGFLSSARKSKVNSNIYAVQLGSFDSLSQAKVMQKKIGRAGFKDSFIR